MDIRKIIKYIDIEIKVLGVGLIYKFILLYFSLYNIEAIYFLIRIKWKLLKLDYFNSFKF